MEGFKETEIGLIPEDWEIVTLNKICNIIMGQSPPSKFYNTENEGPPFFQGRKDFGSKYPNVTMWCSKPKRIAEGDDEAFEEKMKKLIAELSKRFKNSERLEEKIKENIGGLGYEL